MRLSDRIRFARRQRALSQADVACALGVDRSAVGHWERGSGGVPSSRRIVALAGLLGVRVDWLLTGEGQPSAPDDTREACPQAMFANDVTPDELLFLLAWRRLPVVMRQAVLALSEQYALPERKPGRD